VPSGLRGLAKGNPPNQPRPHWGIEIMHRNKDVILGEDGYTNRFGNACHFPFALR
jgi:hypothetical protein